MLGLGAASSGTEIWLEIFQVNIYNLCLVLLDTISFLFKYVCFDVKYFLKKIFFPIFECLAMRKVLINLKMFSNLPTKITIMRRKMIYSSHKLFFAAHPHFGQAIAYCLLVLTKILLLYVFCTKNKKLKAMIPRSLKIDQVGSLSDQISYHKDKDLLQFNYSNWCSLVPNSLKCEAHTFQVGGPCSPQPIVGI